MSEMSDNLRLSDANARDACCESLLSPLVLGCGR